MSGYTLPLLAALCGGLVGLSELLSRYAWAVKPILLSGSGIAYLVINAGMAVLSYKAAVDFDITLGLEGKPEWWRVLVVSVLGMAILRSAFASIRIGERDVGVGLV